MEPEIKEKKKQRAIKIKKPNKTLVLLLKRARFLGAGNISGHKRTAETLTIKEGIQQLAGFQGFDHVDTDSWEPLEAFLLFFRPLNCLA